MPNSKDDPNGKKMRRAIIVAAIIGGIFAIIAAVIQVSGVFRGCRYETDCKLLPGTNILILNACNLDTAHTILYDILLKKCPKIIVDAQYDWLQRGEMSNTRIYYLAPNFKSDTFELEKWFPGKQYVIDFENQSDAQVPDDYQTYMGGFDKKRNIVIFIGNDYRDVFSIK